MISTPQNPALMPSQQSIQAPVQLPPPSPALVKPVPIAPYYPNSSAEIKTNQIVEPSFRAGNQLPPRSAETTYVQSATPVDNSFSDLVQKISQNKANFYAKRGISAAAQPPAQQEFENQESFRLDGVAGQRGMGADEGDGSYNYGLFIKPKYQAPQ